MTGLTHTSLRDRAMYALLALHLVALFVGTLMPNGTREAMTGAISTRPGLHLSAVAHVLLFASLSFLMTRSPYRWRPSGVLGFALFLALLTEGLQFFTPDRHPRWVDVGFDLLGAVLGLGVAGLFRLAAKRRR